MHMNKMFLATALTLSLGATTAYAQEKTTETDQVMTEATEKVEEVLEGAVEKVVEEAGTMAAPMMAKPAGPEGMWVRRKKGQDIKIEFRDGALYCTIVNRTKKSGKAKKDFEMCHGMTAEGDAWKGKNMKHPEMPGFMKFKGTVTVDGDVLKIKGCAGVCQSERWDRAKMEH